MGRLTEGQQGWLQELRALVGAGPAGAEVRLDTDSNGQPTEEGPRRSSAAGQALFDAPVNSAKNANVTLVPDDKLKLPPVDNFELPKVENNLIEIHDSKTGLVEKTLYSELRDSAYYVDNGILSLTAQPTVTTLTVKWMRLTYSGGRKLGIPMERVKFGSGPRDVVRAAEGLHRPARCRRRDPLRQEQHAERRHLRPVGPRRAVAPLSAACRDRGAGRDPSPLP